MTMKQQEIEAMNKIKDIITGLGADSYIGTAMDGVWEIIEENIENDFAISVRDKLNSKDKDIVAVKNERAKLQAEINMIEGTLKATEKSLNGAEHEIELMKEHINEDDKTISKQLEHIRSLQEENSDIVVENNRLKDEIIRLKAKLYDLMIKEVA